MLGELLLWSSGFHSGDPFAEKDLDHRREGTLWREKAAIAAPLCDVDLSPRAIVLDWTQGV